MEISGGEGMNDIEKQAFTLKDYEKVDEITDGQTFYMLYCHSSILIKMKTMNSL